MMYVEFNRALYLVSASVAEAFRKAANADERGAVLHYCAKSGDAVVLTKAA